MKVKIRIPADLENPRKNEWRLVEVDVEKLKSLIDEKKVKKKEVFNVESKR